LSPTASCGCRRPVPPARRRPGAFHCRDPRALRKTPPTEKRAALRARLATAPLPHLPRPTRRRLLHAPRPQRNTPPRRTPAPKRRRADPQRGMGGAAAPRREHRHLAVTGKRRTGVSFGPIRLERLENNQLIEIETWSEQRSGDALIEALKAPRRGPLRQLPRPATNPRHADLDRARSSHHNHRHARQRAV
jgi:hypothetical protein